MTKKEEQEQTGWEAGGAIIGAVIGAVIGAAICLSFSDDIANWIFIKDMNQNFEYLVYVVICIVNMIMPTIIGYCAGNDSSTLTNNVFLYGMLVGLIWLIYTYFGRPSLWFAVAFLAIFLLFFILSINSGIDDKGLFVWWWVFIIIIFSIILAVVYYWGYFKNILDTFIYNSENAAAIMRPFTMHLTTDENMILYGASNYLNII